MDVNTGENMERYDWKNIPGLAVKGPVRQWYFGGPLWQATQKNIRSTQVHCYVKYGKISEALFKYNQLLQQWYQQ